MSLKPLTGHLLPLIIAALIVWWAAPDAIDAYKTKKPGGDFDYLIAGGRVLTDEPFALYDRGIDGKAWQAEHGYNFPGWYPYPPAAALLTVPLGEVSLAGAFTIWRVLIALSVFLLAVCLLRPFKSWSWRIALLAVLACWQPLLLNITIGQTGAFVAALVAVTMSVYLRNPRLGALVLGLLVLKPTAALIGVLTLFPRSMDHWLRFSAVVLAVGFLPFLWLGAEPLRQWLDILTNRTSNDLGGGHSYNQGFTSVLGISNPRLVMIILIAGALGILAVVQRIYDRLGVEASAAFALYAGLLLNPHSLLYDWPAAVVGIALLRRASPVGWTANDTGAGLLAMSLFAAGQLAWRGELALGPMQPLTAWSAALCCYLTVRAFLPAIKLTRLLRPASSAY